MYLFAARDCSVAADGKNKARSVDKEVKIGKFNFVRLSALVYGGGTDGSFVKVITIKTNDILACI